MNISKENKPDLIPTKDDQLVCSVEKAWGREEWIVNNPKYCGKRMVINKGYRCSMHYHKIKEESFYILLGKVFLETKYNGEYSKRVIEAGDVVHIRPYELHRFTGLEHSEMIEFSTHHMDEDSYREELSGKVDLETLIY